jgi:hypothetical protein
MLVGRAPTRGCPYTSNAFNFQLPSPQLVAENTERTEPKVPKLSDDKDYPDRSGQGKNGEIPIDRLVASIDQIWQLYF